MTLLSSEAEEFVRLRAASSGSTDSEGFYVEPTRSTVRYEDGNFQSLSTRETQQLPEGKRHRETWKLFTEASLRTADQFDDRAGDLVRRCKTGVEYEVFEAPRVGNLLSDEKYILVRKQES